LYDLLPKKGWVHVTDVTVVLYNLWKASAVFKHGYNLLPLYCCSIESFHTAHRQTPCTCIA